MYGWAHLNTIILSMCAQIKYKIITLKTYIMDFQQNASILIIKLFIYIWVHSQLGFQKKEKGFQDYLWGYFLQITFT
jgi:hypothetical protein